MTSHSYKYVLTVSTGNTTPSDEPQEFTSLAEAMQAARYEIKSQLDSDDELRWQKWENFTSLKRDMFVHAGAYGITLGVFYYPDRKHDLGQALTIALEQAKFRF